MSAAMQVMVTRLRHALAANGTPLTPHPVCPMCQAQVPVKEWDQHTQVCETRAPRS